MADERDPMAKNNKIGGMNEEGVMKDDVVGEGDDEFVDVDEEEVEDEEDENIEE